MSNKIANLDRRIKRLVAKINSLETIDQYSAQSWQDAWDRHPDLAKRSANLWRLRGEAQLERNREGNKLRAMVSK